MIKKTSTLVILGLIFLSGSLSFKGKDADKLSALRRAFIDSISSFKLPALYLSYAENLKAIKPTEDLERQLRFFEQIKNYTSRFQKTEIPQKYETDFQQIRYETQLNLDRLSLEIPWRKEKHDGIEKEGLYHLSNGKEWYRYFLARWLGDRVVPDDIFKDGVSEIERVKLNIKGIQSKSGMPEVAFYDYLNDSSFYTSDEQELLGLFDHIKHEVQKHLSLLFYTYKIPDLAIKRGTDTRLAQAPGYYDNNTFYYNLFDKPFCKRQVGWLFLHEGVPGHHLQGSIRDRLKPSEVQNLFYYPGYLEGWAAYVEEYGKELGAYNSIFDELGRWEWDIVRAVRVPLDVGINYFGWSDEKALAFWKQHIKNQDGIALREIKRVRNWPCQAITYKYGTRKLLEWRETLRKQKGKNFNIRTFHQTILQNPGLPFFLLEKEVFQN